MFYTASVKWVLIVDRWNLRFFSAECSFVESIEITSSKCTLRYKSLKLADTLGASFSKMTNNTSALASLELISIFASGDS